MTEFIWYFLGYVYFPSIIICLAFLLKEYFQGEKVSIPEGITISLFPFLNTVCSIYLIYQSIIKYFKR